MNSDARKEIWRHSGQGQKPEPKIHNHGPVSMDFAAFLIATVPQGTRGVSMGVLVFRCPASGERINSGVHTDETSLAKVRSLSVKLDLRLQNHALDAGGRWAGGHGGVAARVRTAYAGSPLASLRWPRSHASCCILTEGECGWLGFELNGRGRSCRCGWR